MVHAVHHLAPRIHSFTAVTADQGNTAAIPSKGEASTFASSLKSLFGGTPAVDPVATAQAAPAPAALAPASTPAAPTPDTSLKALFGQPVTPVAAAPPAPSAPTAESVFGPNPWMTAPTCQGPNGVTFSYNPIFFATPATAQKVAQMVGGTVVQSNQFTPNGGPFQQQQGNWMVQLPNGNLINPGLVASFYTHGYPQSYVDGLIAGAVNNS
jgi:hypothetical protein